MRELRGTGVLMGRAMRLSMRNVDGLITALLLPVMLMVMFVYLFGGAIAPGTSYVNYVVPGVVLVCVGFGAATTAVTVAQDMRTGIIDRFRSMDLRGESLINSHVVASVARNAVSAVLVVLVALAIGFRSSADVPRWAGAAGILALYALAISWLAAAIGVSARSAEAASGVAFIVSFLPYPSSAFVPVSTMPSWLRGFAESQPATAVIDTVRGLTTGRPVGAAAWHAVAWSIGILAVSIVLTGVLYRRRRGD
jgi:ABC-2 type transport system permease protein